MAGFKRTRAWSRKNASRKRRRTWARKPRMSRQVRFPPAVVKRTSISTPWAVATTTTADFWRYIAPTAANFYNFSEFQNVFDQYKFNGIKVTFRPRFTQVNAPTTGGTPMTVRMPYACIVNDSRSTLLPTGTYGSTALQTLLENGGRIVRADKPFSVYFKPQVQCQTSVGSGTYYRNAPYINTSDTSTTMRGFHIMLYTEGFGTNFVDLEYDVYYTFYTSFKNIK